MAVRGCESKSRVGFGIGGAISDNHGHGKRTHSHSRSTRPIKDMHKNISPDDTSFQDSIDMTRMSSSSYVSRSSRRVPSRNQNQNQNQSPNENRSPSQNQTHGSLVGTAVEMGMGTTFIQSQQQQPWSSPFDSYELNKNTTLHGLTSLSPTPASNSSSAVVGAGAGASNVINGIAGDCDSAAEEERRDQDQDQHQVQDQDRLLEAPSGTSRIFNQSQSEHKTDSSSNFKPKIALKRLKTRDSGRRGSAINSDIRHRQSAYSSSVSGSSTNTANSKTVIPTLTPTAEEENDDDDDEHNERKHSYDDNSNYEDSNSVPVDYSAKGIKLDESPTSSLSTSNNLDNLSSYQSQFPINRNRRNSNKNPNSRRNQKIKSNPSPSLSPNPSQLSLSNPDSHLRHRLTTADSMNSPPAMTMVHSSIHESVLNLSKAQSPTSGRHPTDQHHADQQHCHGYSLGRESRSGSAFSSGSVSRSISPPVYPQEFHSFEVQRQHQLLLQQRLQMLPNYHGYVTSTSPRSSVTAIGSGTVAALPSSSTSDLVNGSGHVHLNGSGLPGINSHIGPSQASVSVTATSPFSQPQAMNYLPYGFGAGGSPVSPVMANVASVPISFNAGLSIFPNHFTAGSASQSLTTNNNVSSPSVIGGARTDCHSASKGRTTRPFKAYPKDPMSFSAGSMYGLPVGIPLGTTDSLMRQSNLEYASFRTHMLSQAQANKTKRGGQRNGMPPISDSVISSPSQGPYSHSHGLGNENENNCSGEDDNSHSGVEDEAGAESGGRRGCKRKHNATGKTEEQLMDPVYRERRRKNNEAAKRSRDARRAKEDEIAIRAAFLEQENVKLRLEVSIALTEISRLRKNLPTA